MRIEMPKWATNRRRQFIEEDDGLALTEYLILLGLLTSGVITAVLAIGDNMEKAWTGWSTWYDTTLVSLAGPGADLGSETDETAPLAAAPVASKTPVAASTTVTKVAKKSKSGDKSGKPKKSKKKKSPKKKKEKKKQK